MLPLQIFSLLYQFLNIPSELANNLSYIGHYLNILCVVSLNVHIILKALPNHLKVQNKDIDKNIFDEANKKNFDIILI